MDLIQLLSKLAMGMLPFLAVAYIVVGVHFLHNPFSGRINYFSHLMFASAIYTFGYFLEMQTYDPTVMWWVRGFEFLGTTTLPAFGILFIVEYIQKKPLPRRNTVELLGLSFILWIANLTNPLHHLFYEKFQLLHMDWGTAVITEKGPIYYLLLVYFCVFLLVSVFLLAKAIFASQPSEHNGDKKVLIVTFLIPMISVALIVFGLDHYVDPVPFTIILMNLMFLINATANDMLGQKAFSYEYEMLVMQMKQGLAVHEIICDEFGMPIDYRFISVNGSFELLTGLKRQDIVGHTVLEVLPHTEKYWIEIYGKVALTGEPYQYSNYSLELNRYFDVFAYSPKHKQFAVIFSDVTEFKKLEKDVYVEKEMLRTTVMAVGDGIISTDADGKVQIMNETAEALTSIKQKDGVGKDLDQVLYIIEGGSKAKWINPAGQVYETGQPISFGGQKFLMANSGKEIPVEGIISPITNEEGITIGTVVIFRDTTEQKKKHEEILYLSYHDQLTGLYNRRYFEEELKRLNTVRNLPMTLMMFDVNGLKLINDAFGHQVADQVLQTVGWSLRRECRADDIIARIGGDEFILLLPKTDSDMAEVIGERIHQSMGSETIQGIPLSVAYGWETKRETDTDMGEVFKNAEDYMYMHKLAESASTRHGIVDVIMKTLFEKSPEEKAHSQRVGNMAGMIGAELKLNLEQIDELKALGLMHDIGKIAVRDDTLNKTTPLTSSEWIEIKRHAEIGYKILSSAHEYLQMAEYVLQHHEHLDGTGYPKGLRGTDISLQAKIIAVVDAYDAMINPQPYRERMLPQQAVEELKKCASIQFDEEVVQAFVRVVQDKDLKNFQISEGPEL